MKIEILKEVPRVAGHCFRQKGLGTEMVWDGQTPFDPMWVQMFRISFRTGVYRGPDGEQFTYEELVKYHLERDIKFQGCGHFLEAIDIEYWEDEGDDGHIDWMYQRAYRMWLFEDEEDTDGPWRWLNETSGTDIMRLLADHVYDLNRVKRREEYDAK